MPNLSAKIPMPITETNVSGGLSIFNFTKDGESEPSKILDKNWVNLFWWGTFDGATVKLLVSPNGVEWFEDPDYVKTARDRISSEVLGNCWIKWVVTGAGSNTRVSASVV